MKKLYYSNVPITTVHVMKGPSYCEAVQFVGGVLETDDAAVIAHLDKIADKPSSGITSEKVSNVDPAVAAAAADAKAAAEKAHAKMVAAGLSTA